MPSLFSPAAGALVSTIDRAVLKHSSNSRKTAFNFIVLSTFGGIYLSSKAANEGNLASIIPALAKQLDETSLNNPLMMGQWRNAQGSEKVCSDCIQFMRKYAIPLGGLESSQRLVDLISGAIVAGNNWMYGTNIKEFYNFSKTICVKNLLSGLATNVLGYIPASTASRPILDGVSAAGKVIFPDDETMAARAAGYILQSSYVSQWGNGPAANFDVPDDILQKSIDETQAFFESQGQDQENVREYIRNSYNNLDIDSLRQEPEQTAPDNTVPEFDLGSPSVGETTVQEPQAAPVPQTSVQPQATQQPQAAQTPQDPVKKPAAPKIGKPAQTAPVTATTAQPAQQERPGGLHPTSFDILSHMAVDEDQLRQAFDVLTSGSYALTPYLTTYQPGLTEKAAAQLLDKYTDKASHRPYKVTPGDPHERRSVMTPPIFKIDPSTGIWSKVVVTSMGFPFINFRSPVVMELVRGTKGREIRRAYRQLKKIFRQCRMRNPISTLKAFAQEKYRDCSLNSLVVNAEELLVARPGMPVSASVVDPYSTGTVTKGAASIPTEFLMSFYNVLSPVSASREYAALSGMDEQSYMNYLSEKGQPPVYILTPKRCVFKRGARKGLLRSILGNPGAGILIRAHLGSHDGGFIMPERIANLLFGD